MKAVLFQGQGRVEVREIPQPDPEEGQILLRVRASALCGSELNAYRRQGLGGDTIGTPYHALRRLGVSATIHGRVAFIGEKQEASIRPSPQFIRKELTVFGSWYFTGANYFRILGLRSRGLDVSGLITHRFPLRKADQAFSTFASGQSGKVILLQEEG